MVEDWITQALPRTSSIDDASFTAFLASLADSNLQHFSEALSTHEEIPYWIKEAVTLEMAHQRALQHDETVESPEWFKGADADTLGLLHIKLAPHTEHYPFTHDVMTWYALEELATTPREQECYAVVGKEVHPLSEAQYQLLDAICTSNMLGDAFDKWVRDNPALSAEHASEVGEWLRNWINQGVLVR